MYRRASKVNMEMYWQSYRFEYFQMEQCNARLAIFGMNMLWTLSDGNMLVAINMSSEQYQDGSFVPAFSACVSLTEPHIICNSVASLIRILREIKNKKAFYGSAYLWQMDSKHYHRHMTAGHFYKIYE